MAKVLTLDELEMFANVRSEEVFNVVCRFRCLAGTLTGQAMENSRKFVQGKYSGVDSRYAGFVHHVIVNPLKQSFTGRQLVAAIKSLKVSRSPSKAYQAVLKLRK